MSKLKRILKKVLLTYCITGTVIAAFIMGTAIYRTKQAIDNKGKIEEYLKQNKQTIESEVEQKFDISLEGVALEFVDGLSNNDWCMKYFYQEDLISVDINKAPPLLEIPKSFYIPVLSNQTTKGSYIHELGHDYYYQIKGELKTKGLLHPSFQNNLVSDIPLSTIKEGISNYFEVEMEQGSPNSNVKYPKSFQEIGTMYSKNEHYEIGRKIVKPILDELGVKNGLIAILTQPLLTEQEILNPQSYHIRIFNGAKELVLH